MAHRLSQAERNARIARWKDDAGKIGAALTSLSVSWECSNLTFQVVRESRPLKKHNSYFYLNQFVLRGLLDAVIIGIRRQLDTDENVLSLMNFMDEMKRNAAVYSLQDCIDAHLARGTRMGFHGPDLEQCEARARSLYAFVADADNTMLSAKRIKGVVATLKRLSKDVTIAANKYVAHQDRVAPEISLPLNQVDDVMKVLYGIANQYLPIFNGGNSDAFGHVDAQSWLSMFDFAWRGPALPE